MAARRNLHLRGLQAAHSKVLEIIEDAPHVALYRFSPEERKWSRMDIEGSAYVTRNSESPFYSFIVLNKKGSEDLILQIIPHVKKILLQDQYVMMKCLNDAGEIIFGVWIHDDAERQRVYDSISRILTVASSPAQSDNMNNLLNKLAIAKVSSDSGRVAAESVPVNPVPESVNPTTPSTNMSTKLLSVLKKPNSDANASPPPLPKVGSGSPTSTASNASPPLIPVGIADGTDNGSPQPSEPAANMSAMKSQKLLSLLKSNAPISSSPIKESNGTVVDVKTEALPPQSSVKLTKKTDQLLSILSSNSQPTKQIPTTATNINSQPTKQIPTTATNINQPAPVVATAVSNSNNSIDLLTDADIAKSLLKAKKILTENTVAMTTNTNSKPSIGVNKTIPPTPVASAAVETTAVKNVSLTTSTKVNLGSPVLTGMSSTKLNTSSPVPVVLPATTQNVSPNTVSTKITASVKKPVLLISPSDLENM